MNEKDLWKLDFLVKQFARRADIIDEIGAEYRNSDYLPDKTRGSQSKIINEQYRELITELEEVTAELKAKAKPYMVEDVEFYDEEENEIA